MSSMYSIACLLPDVGRFSTRNRCVLGRMMGEYGDADRALDHTPPGNLECSAYQVRPEVARRGHWRAAPACRDAPATHRLWDTELLTGVCEAWARGVAT